METSKGRFQSRNKRQRESQGRSTIERDLCSRLPCFSVTGTFRTRFPNHPPKQDSIGFFSTSTSSLTNVVTCKECKDEEQEPCPTTSGSIERGVVHPRSRSCRGCLFYSSFLRDNNQNPTCYGFSRSIPETYRTLEERQATKDFKYACLGYGVHKEAAGNGRPPPEGNGEIPLCVGIEFLADRRPVSSPRKEEGADPMHHHNPLARPGSTPSEDFTSRFCRSASVVATAVVNNVIRIAANAKATVDDLLGSNDKKSK